MKYSSWMMLFYILPLNSYAKDITYNLADLEALEKDNKFEEFLLHVNDIRPSLRSKHWAEMYQNMSLFLIDYRTKTKDYKRESFNQIEEIAKNSIFTKDELFQIKRSQYFKKYLSTCFSKAEKNQSEFSKCEADVNSFWYFSNKDADIGIDIANILTKNDSQLNTWPFYSMAIKDKINSFYCEKENIQNALMKKIYTESSSEEFSGNYKDLLDKYAPETCFNKLVPSLRNTILSSQSMSIDKELALNLLISKNLIKSHELELYGLIYLIDGPVTGKVMNSAWKNIESLLENYQRRISLLEQVKQLPILPDKIFKDPNLPRHKAIINLLAKNFPEFLNYYGQSCIDFLSHKDSTNFNVSSSFQCNEFLKASANLRKQEKVQWLSDSINLKFSALKK